MCVGGQNARPKSGGGGGGQRPTPSPFPPARFCVFLFSSSSSSSSCSFILRFADNNQRRRQQQQQRQSLTRPCVDIVCRTRAGTTFQRPRSSRPTETKPPSSSLSRRVSHPRNEPSRLYKPHHPPSSLLPPPSIEHICERNYTVPAFAASATMTYNARRPAPNLSDFVNQLNAIPSAQDLQAAENFSLEDDLAMFTNTQFFDFDLGQDADVQPADFDERSGHTVAPENMDLKSVDFGLQGMFYSIMLLSGVYRAIVP
jgi:hypothetical protein